jgi:Ca-activated chloride channel family protein
MTDLLTFELNVDADLISKEVPCQRIVEMAITSPAAKNQNHRLPLNLSLVIDRSGSMSGHKFEFVKQAACYALDTLREDDRVSIVAYDTEVTLIAESVFVSAAKREALKHAVQAMRIGSSTNLSGGWLRGCEEVASGLMESGVNRVLLLTDGLANVGITGLEELGMHAAQLLLRGVSTSTFGVGGGFNEHLLEYMANQGGGKFYYIDTPHNIPAIFQQEFQEMLAVTARSVEVEVEIPSGVSAQVMGSWRNELRNNSLHLWLGDLAALHRREVYLKVLTPPSLEIVQLMIQAEVSAKDEEGLSVSRQASVTLRYASQLEASQAPIRREVMERFTSVELADKSTEALKLERAGEREKAAHLLEMSMLSSAPYMTAESREDYERLSKEMRHGMDEQERKTRHQEAYLRKQRRG